MSIMIRRITKPTTIRRHRLLFLPEQQRLQHHYSYGSSASSRAKDGKNENVLLPYHHSYRRPILVPPSPWMMFQQQQQPRHIHRCSRYCHYAFNTDTKHSRCSLLQSQSFSTKKGKEGSKEEAEGKKQTSSSTVNNNNNMTNSNENDDNEDVCDIEDKEGIEIEAADRRPPEIILWIRVVMTFTLMMTVLNQA